MKLRIAPALGCLLFVAGLVAVSCAAEPEAIPLWPEGVPDGRSDAAPEHYTDAARKLLVGVHEPALLHFAPEHPVGTAIVVCPGGGYRFLSMLAEGDAIADWLTPLGIDVFVLKYRLNDYKFPAQLRDVTRAVRIVRARHAEWGVREDRIGVLGFSAGGHLASMASTLYGAPEARTGAGLDGTSARPDFSGLIYPVIAMNAPFMHRGSKDNLIGESPSPELADRVSTQLQIDAQTPPTFLLHSGSDTVVPVANSLVYYQALIAAGVPAEMHIYDKGGHGFGIKPGYGALSDWPRLFEAWLRGRGLLP